jgi:hypothetical protein
MQAHFRQFDIGPDPFGRTWKVAFRWLQVGISIRHADTIDVKFILQPDDGPEEEKVIALPHPALLDVARRRGRVLTDPWCMKIAALHIRRMITTAEDIEKTVVTLSAGEIEEHDNELRGQPVAAR